MRHGTLRRKNELFSKAEAEEYSCASIHSCSQSSPKLDERSKHEGKQQCRHQKDGDSRQSNVPELGASHALSQAMLSPI